MLRWIGMGVAESRSDMVPATGFEPVRFYSLEPESSASANSATRAIFNTIHWNLIAVWIYACDSVCDSGGALKSSQRRAIELLQIQVHFDTHTRSFGISASTQFPAAIPQGSVEFGIASGGAIFKGARQRRRESRCWRRPECEDKSPVRCEGDVLKCQRADCTKPVCRLAEGGPFNRSIRVEAPPNVPGTGRAIGSLAIGSAFPIAPICRELWQRVQTPRSR